MSEEVPDDAQDKRTRILDAAESTFAAYGFARTSMADIAAGSDMSRPALYQHYANKEEIFTAVLVRLLNNAADAALEALSDTAELSDALDGFLQRWTGDLTERFRATQHGADLVGAKQGHAKEAVSTILARVRGAVAGRLADHAPSKRVPMLTDLLLLSPVGLKTDDPSMPVLRNRLSELAVAVASASV